MTTDFTAKNIYEFEAKGTRSTKAAIDKVKKAQAAAAKQALRDYEAQGKGSKNLAQKFEVLTSSIGGTSTAFGKAAEGGKRVAEGFGLMGVGIMGVGFALQALAPAVGSLISDLGDLAAFGTLERWTPLQDRIDETTARMEIATAAAKAWRAEQALLTPVELAASKAQVAQEQNVARQRALIDAQAALQRAKEYGGSNALALELKVIAAKHEAEAAVYRQVEAETKLGDVQERVAKAEAARARARAKRNGLQATGSGVGLGGLFGAAGGAQAGVGNIMSAGIAATDLASVADGVAIPGAIPGIEGIVPPDTGPTVIERLFGSPEQIDAVSASFGVLAAGVNEMFDALANGDGAAAAWEAFQKTIAKSLAELMFRYAKAEAAHAAASFAIQDYRGMALHIAAAAAFTGAGAFAGSFAGSSGGGGSSSYGSYDSSPSLATTQNSRPQIFVFAGGYADDKYEQAAKVHKAWDMAEQLDGSDDMVEFGG